MKDNFSGYVRISVLPKKKTLIDIFYHQIWNDIQGYTTRAPHIISRGGRVRTGDQTIYISKNLSRHIHLFILSFPDYLSWFLILISYPDFLAWLILLDPVSSCSGSPLFAAWLALLLFVLHINGVSHWVFIPPSTPATGDPLVCHNPKTLCSKTSPVFPGIKGEMNPAMHSPSVSSPIILKRASGWALFASEASCCDWIFYHFATGRTVLRKNIRPRGKTVNDSVTIPLVVPGGPGHLRSPTAADTRLWNSSDCSQPVLGSHLPALCKPLPGFEPGSCRNKCICDEVIYRFATGAKSLAQLSGYETRINKDKSGYLGDNFDGYLNGYLLWIKPGLSRYLRMS